MALYYREDLDALECSTYNCHCTEGPLFLRQGCHSQRDGVVVRYDRDGVLRVSCIKCGRLVCNIVVASKGKRDAAKER